MNLHHEMILLAEDDPNDVLLMRHVFDKAKLLNPLKVVTDGDQVIAYLNGDGQYGDRQQYPLPLVLLLDLKLPRKSGFEVLQWIRQHPTLKRLPVVVLTSSRETPDINRAYDLGANSYLVKPGKIEALLELAKTLNLYWGIANEKPDLYP